MDEPYLLAATRHVERNPVKAGLVGRAEDWMWSSAAAHVKDRPDGVAETAWLSERIAGWSCTWRQYLRGAEDRAFVAAMRRGEATGRPLGERAFVRRLERLLGRSLLPGKPGRPRKRKKQYGVPR
jgi:putative transposase